MIRLYWLCRYFDKLHGRRGGTIQYYEDNVDKNEFLNHVLNEKHLGEDVREIFKRWIYCLTSIWVLQGGKGMHRAQKRRRMIFDLVEDAKKREYLIESDTRSSNPKLRMDDRGRKFIKLLTFLSVMAKEYSDITSVLLTVLTSIGGTLLVVFFQRIIEWFAYLL